MKIKNILISTVLMSWTTFDLIQGEIIRGLDVPRMNIPRLSGQWYLNTFDEEKQLSCYSSVIEQTSDNTYTANATYTYTDEARKENPNIHPDPASLFYSHNLLNDSNLIIAKDLRGDPTVLVILYVDYNSYIAMYQANTTAQAISGTEGQITIYSRQPILPSGIFDKVINSDFYKLAVKSDYKLHIVDFDACS